MRLEHVESLPELVDDWRRLADAGDNIFATWEWASTWWEHYGHDRELRLTAVCGDAGVEAILPLYLWRRRPLRVLRFVGHGRADVLGPVAPRRGERVGWDALTAVLAGDTWDVFVGEQLPAAAPLPSVAAPVTRGRSPVLRFEGRDWDGYLRSRSRNFRQIVRRRSRNLAGGYEVRFRLANEGSLERDLDTLFALHRERWRAFVTDFSRAEAFHRAFARAALGRGWLRLWLLELDGAPAAAWYGFRFGDAEWFHQSGRSLRFERLSVGLVLLTHTVREAQADGVAEYRFLRGGERYKYRFTDDDPGLVTVAATRGPAARAALASVVAARRLRQAAATRSRRSPLPAPPAAGVRRGG